MRDVAAAAGVRGGEAEIARMLARFHATGALCHWTGERELSRTVVLRPQWLVDAAAAILREVCPRGDEGADGGAAREAGALELDGAVRARQREAEARHPGDWEQLASSALVSETLLEFFWDDGDHAKRSEYLICLLYTSPSPRDRG